MAVVVIAVVRKQSRLGEVVGNFLWEGSSVSRRRGDGGKSDIYSVNDRILRPI